MVASSILAMATDAERAAMLRDIVEEVAYTRSEIGKDAFDARVMDAMAAVPREVFVPESHRLLAFANGPVPIGHGQTISQPYMVALMTSLLGADVRSRVLDVGTGSGYQAAVLAEVAGEVYSVERITPLAEGARRRLARLGYHTVRCGIGDGARGWPEHAPYHGILVAAAADEPPGDLLEQLADGGRLVVPLGAPHRDQVLTVVERRGDGFLERRDTPCRFVPLVPGAGQGRGAAEAPVATPEEVGGMRSVRVRVSGRVQGVYYRASAQAEARRLGVGGWVRNKPDGSVLLHAQGDPAAVDALLEWCRGGPPGADVTMMEVEDVTTQHAAREFEIR